MGTSHKISGYGPGLNPLVAQTRYRLRIKLAPSTRLGRRTRPKLFFSPVVVGQRQVVEIYGPVVVFAKITARARLRKRQYMLGDPVVVRAAAVVEIYGPTVVRAASRRGKTKPSVLRPPAVVTPAVPEFLLQENGDKIILEDGSGFILL